MSSLTISMTEIDLRARPIRSGRRLEADFRLARLAVGEERPGVARQRRKLARLVAGQIFRRGAAEQERDEAAGTSPRSSRSIAARRIDQGARGALLVAGTVDDGSLVHGRGLFMARIIAALADCSGFARQRKGCRLRVNNCGRLRRADETEETKQ